MALGGGGQQGVGDGHGPQAVLAVHVWPLAGSENAYEFVELGTERATTTLSQTNDGPEKCP